MNKQIFNRSGMSAVITAFSGMLLLILVFTLLNPNFASANNLTQLLRAICPVLLVGIGQGIVCISGNIDLSIGSVVGMSAMISATLICKGVHPVWAILITLLASFLVGIINGILVGKYKISSFIATLGTMTIIRGVAQMANNNYNTDSIGTSPAVEVLRSIFYYGKIGPIYYIVIISFVIFLILNYVMNQTKTGRYIYAIGSNYEAARLSGVSVVKTITITYSVSSLCACVAGIIIMTAAGMGSMQAGISYEVYGVAAAVIGGISTLGGSGLLLGVIPGASIWAILQNGLTIANVPAAIRNIVIGIIVIVCVMLDVSGRNAKRSSRKNINGKVKGIVFIGLIVVTAVVTAVTMVNNGRKNNSNSTGEEINIKASLITMDQTDAHWTLMNDAVQKRVEEYKKEGINIEVKWNAPETKDSQKQLEMISSAISDNMDYIIISPTDTTSPVRQLEEAKKAGIGVIFVDSTCDTDALATYKTDNYQGGVLAGESLLKLLTDKGITEGTIGCIDTIAGMYSTQLRFEGFVSVFEGTGFTIAERQYCEGDSSKAQEIANTFINNDYIAIYGTNENGTNGAGASVREARNNGKEVILVGWDKSTANLDYVEKGDIKTLIVQNPAQMGKLAVDAIADLTKGKKVSPEPVDTGVNVVTKENVEEMK